MPLSTTGRDYAASGNDNAPRFKHHAIAQNQAWQVDVALCPRNH
jgi:hypothetical protein